MLTMAPADKLCGHFGGGTLGLSEPKVLICRMALTATSNSSDPETWKMLLAKLRRFWVVCDEPPTGNAGVHLG